MTRRFRYGVRRCYVISARNFRGHCFQLISALKTPLRLLNHFECLCKSFFLVLVILVKLFVELVANRLKALSVDLHFLFRSLFE